MAEVENAAASGMCGSGSATTGLVATVMLGFATVACWSYYLGAPFFMQSDEPKIWDLFAMFAERQEIIEQLPGERIKECQWHLADSEAETKKMWEELHPSKEHKEVMDQRAEDEACFADALAKLEKEVKIWSLRWAMGDEFNWVKALNSLGVCQDDTRCLCYHLIKADRSFMKSMEQYQMKIDDWTEKNDKRFGLKKNCNVRPMSIITCFCMH